MHTFLIIWIGQFVSLIGSTLTHFALGVWVYLETGSVTPLSLVVLFSTIPHLILAPFAGALVDRWDRRTAMILSDSGAAVCTGVIALLLMLDTLEIWHIYIISLVSASFSTFQWPAYSAATTLLVPKKHLARAAGMVQTAESVSAILSPAIAGVLILTIEIWGVLCIDVGTFLFALLTLTFIRIPRPESTAERSSEKTSLIQEVRFGMRYIWSRPGLVILLLFFAGINLLYSSFNVLFVPMILTFSSAVVLGTLESIGGIGMLIGGVLLSVWGGPRKKLYGVLGGGFVGGIAMLFIGIRQNIAIIAAANFLSFFTLPIINGCSQAIWQVKTAPDVQGRVFSVRRAIAWSTAPISYLLVGPLADLIFEPALAINGTLSGTVGKIVGVGPGRGIGLMLVLMGVCIMIISMGFLLYRPFRNVEEELPDMVLEESD
ncbi:MAG: MFS transporter [Theionarchaea archaeon]|nr:MFS transporter [Theionarchaea archaeon]